MSIEPYELKRTDDYLCFYFYSQGPKGEIRKVILYTLLYKFNDLEFYNLGFGDELTDGVASDLAVSNNKDRDKILRTVALSGAQFFERYPHATVLVRGSTPSRMRLYAIQISRHWNALEKVVDIQGYTGISWELFKMNTSYTQLAITRKIL